MQVSATHYMLSAY